jgi:cytochrome c-type biogenesis protein CcmH/NrfF
VTIVISLLLLSLPTIAHAQTTDRDASPEAFALSSEIMSPFCPGLTLAACPSGAATELRSEIANRLRAGESSSAIVENLVERFGESVRGMPRPRGVALSLWVVPPVIGAGILWALYRTAARRRQTPVDPDEIAVAPATELALESRLDEELRQLG